MVNMRCDLWVIQFTEKNKNIGSVSVETAIILPFVFLIFFVFASFFQYIAAYLNVYQAADLTAKYMSYYSGIYYREGIERLDGFLIDKIYDGFGQKGLPASELFTSITDNAACSAIADAIFQKQLEKNSAVYINNFYELDDISFAGSSFFDSGNGFRLNVRCTVDTFLPLPGFFGKGYLINISISGNGWLGGSYFVKESEPSIWELDNFNRGKAVEEYLECNLPYDYPIIDKFERKTGTVTLIRSIDHTTKKYLKVEQFIKEMEKSLEKIREFDGTENFSTVETEYVIKAKEIKKRKLILVVPTNDMTAAQMKAVLEFTAECVSSNVEFVVERYHVSP